MGVLVFIHSSLAVFAIYLRLIRLDFFVPVASCASGCSSTSLVLQRSHNVNFLFLLFANKKNVVRNAIGNSILTELKDCAVTHLPIECIRWSIMH